MSWYWYLYGTGVVGVIAYMYYYVLLHDSYRDEWLDQKLKENEFKYRPGMEFPDYEIMNRIGSERWKTTEQAQKRVSR